MIHPKVKALANARAEVARLEVAIFEELASLHEEYGFESTEAFIVALESGGRSGEGRTTKTVKVRKRAKITDSIRAKVGKLVKAGKAGAQIAKMLKISLPSVQNIKKVLGLVKSAKKRGSKAKVRAATTKKLLKRKAQKSRASAKKAIMQQSSPFQPVGESEGLSA